MTLRRPALRAFWRLLAVLQLVLPGAASVADAQLEATSISARPTSHIEEHGGAHCARVHPEDCALCRVLSTTGTPASATPAFVAAALRIAPSSDGPVRVTRLGHHSARSRAPPAVA
jgi:hypothetical protein